MFDYTQQINVTDLMSYLSTEWRRHLLEHTNEQRENKGQSPLKLEDVKNNPSVEAFVEWSKKRLKQYPPVSQAFLDQGFALRLQNGVVVSFAPAEETVASAMRDTGIPITNPRRYPGVPDIVPVGAIDI